MKTIYDKLESLPALVNKAKKFYNENDDELLANGLISPEEHKALTKEWDIRSRAYSAGETASHAVPYPNIDAILPPEFVALRNQCDAAKEQRTKERDITDAVNSLRPEYYTFSKYAFPHETGLAVTARKILDKLKKTPSIFAELDQLEIRLDAKQRRNSKVRKIRMAAFDAYGKAQDLAKSKAVKNILKRHAKVINEADRIKQAIPFRRMTALKDTRIAIARILNEALKGSE